MTGHRSEDCEEESIVRNKIRDAIRVSGCTVCITGMANGCDLWFADEARLLGVPIWCAKPWTGHKARATDRALYQQIIDCAERVVNVTDSLVYPGPWAYHKRNEWMVDHADAMLAYWTGKESGGTYACLQYAKNKEVPTFRNIYGRL